MSEVENRYGCPQCGRVEHIGVEGVSATGPLSYRTRYVCRAVHLEDTPTARGVRPRDKGPVRWQVLGKIRNWPPHE